MTARLVEPPLEEVRIELRQAYPISGRLGVGAEAWAELQEVEQQGIEHRNIDTSGVSLRWRTFQTVMNALRHCGEKHYVNPPAGRLVDPSPQCQICQMDGVKDSPAAICRWHYQKALEAEGVDPSPLAQNLEKLKDAKVCIREFRRRAEAGMTIVATYDAVDAMEWLLSEYHRLRAALLVPAE